MILPFLPQGDDARLAVVATLERPRLTYAEFGAWVQNRTHLPVTVAPAIRERKATVLVADRPVGETMTRFADAFFLEWERTAAGLKLRLQPKVAGEEETALEAEADARAAAFRKAIGTVMALSRMTPEEIEEAGATRYTYDPATLAAGELLRGLSDSERAAVLGGRRVFGTDKGGAGIVRLSKRWAEPLGKQFEDAGAGAMGGDGEAPPPRKPTDGILVIVQGDSATNRLKITASPRAADGDTLGTSNTYVDGSEAIDAAGPLDARLAAWAKGDAALLATKLRRDATPFPAHSSSRLTLADLLVSLHRRSGLPLVADGFREAASDSNTPDGVNVGGWLKRLADGPMAGTPEYVVRASDGWVEMRRAKYWRRLATEPGEAAVVALERAVPTLDGPVAFARTVTPVQADHLDSAELVMDVPNAAVSGKLPFLRFWDALTPSHRREAMGEEGLALAESGVEASRLALEVLAQVGGEESMNDDLIPSFMPGGPPLPKGLLLAVEARPDMSDYEFPAFSRRPNGRPPEPILHHYQGFSARIQGEEQAFMIFEFPLREKKR